MQELKTETHCFCQICGIALKNSEIGGEIRGEYIDYIKRVPGKISATFCTECWHNMQERSKGGIEAAIRRRKELLGDV